MTTPFDFSGLRGHVKIGPVTISLNDDKGEDHPTHPGDQKQAGKILDAAMDILNIARKELKREKDKDGSHN